MPNTNISIQGLNKAKVLAALYNHAKSGGMGAIEYDPKHIMTEEEAVTILQKDTEFQWLKGRIMKINMSSDKEIDPWRYDRDNGGDGTAAKIIDALR
jgi:hypothetical protein